ncbi:MAG: hypothetical protein K9G26_03525 [Emcibacter sp.]|nr:hypothetical protein [Emcibacter sp.]
MFFSLTTALWISLFSFQNADLMSSNENRNSYKNDFLEVELLTKIKPLELQYSKNQIDITSPNREIIHNWTKQVIKYNIPIYIHSFASLPSAIMNLSEDIARHDAVHVAFNRGVIIKNIILQQGIKDDHVIITASAQCHSINCNTVIITTRRE